MSCVVQHPKISFFNKFAGEEQVLLVGCCGKDTVHALLEAPAEVLSQLDNVILTEAVTGVFQNRKAGLMKSSFGALLGKEG